MRYLIIDKKQRIQLTADSTHSVTRVKEELDKIGATYVFATTDDIEIELTDKVGVKVLGEDILNFTHIILRGHRLEKLWEYETKHIIAHYIDQHNRTNPEKAIKLQNAEAIKSLPYYDKLWIQKVCIENGIATIPTHYKTSGDFSETTPYTYPFIIKDFTGENEIMNINGKDTVKKNVYLIEKPEDLKQERLLNKDTSKYFIQKFIPTGVDMRIFVQNGKVIGGFSRKATEGFMTVKAGEYESIFPVKDNRIIEIAQKVATVFKADFMAVDLMEDENGHIMMQEISFNPGFKAYETKCSGETVNIAQAIVQSFGK